MLSELQYKPGPNFTVLLTEEFCADGAPMGHGWMLSAGWHSNRCHEIGPRFCSLIGDKV